MNSCDRSSILHCSQNNSAAKSKTIHLFDAPIRENFIWISFLNLEYKKLKHSATF